MAATHSVEGHALLSAEAVAAGTVAEQTEVAERALSIDADYTGTEDEEAIKSAIALQVSYQVAMDFVYSNMGRGSRSHGARSNAAGLAPPLHPLAQKIVQGVKGDDGWADIRTRR